MPVDPKLIGTFQLLAGLIALLFLKPAFDHRGKPGSRSFGIMLSGVALWSFGLFVGNFTGDVTLSIAAFNVVLLGIEVVAAAWFLITATVTNRTTVTDHTYAGLAIWIGVMQVLVWTNPVHNFVFGPGTRLDGIVLVPAYNLGFHLHTVVSYALVAIGIGFLVVEAIETTGLRRKQMTLLTLSGVPLLVMSLVTLFDVFLAPYDVSPFGYLLSAILLALVLFRGRFLDVVTVARRTAMGQMDDAMVTLDAQDRVVDANVAARDLFDVGEDYVETPAADFFAPISDDVQAQFTDAVDVDTEVEITLDGERRHFSVSVNPIGTAGESSRVFVMRDITLLKEREQELRDREQELDLMRQVQSRVLRHNIRNDMQTVKLANQAVIDAVDGEDERLVQQAIETANDLLAISDKTRAVEQLVDKEQTPTQLDLRVVLREIIESYRSEFPDVTFSLDCPGECFVEISPSLEIAIENVIENAAEHGSASPDSRARQDAAEHNGGTTQTVDVTVTEATDEVVVTISDDGPGISTEELTVIEREAETSLQHGSGMGLWVVKWAIDTTDASIQYDTDDGGTTVTVRIPR